MVCDTPSSQDAYTQLNWDSSLKLYKRYAPDTIIRKTRLDGKVTVICKSYWILHHPKIHPHTKCGIPTSNNVRVSFQYLCQIIFLARYFFQNCFVKAIYMTLGSPLICPSMEVCPCLKSQTFVLSFYLVFLYSLPVIPPSI